MSGCKKCGGNEFRITSDKPFMQECIKFGDKEVWRPGERSAEPRDDTCIVCLRKIGKNQGGHSLHGQPAHRKCMIAYTAWEVGLENPQATSQKNRILQVGRNLEHFYRKIENKANIA